MGIVSSVCTYIFVEVFDRLEFMCRSDFIVQVTPPLFFALILYRIFGPEDQGVSFGHTQVSEVDKKDIVDSTTYAGGGGLPSDSEFLEEQQLSDEEVYMRKLKTKVD